MWGRRLRLLIKEGAPHARHFKISGFINSVREAKVETTSDHPSFHVWDRDTLCPLTGRVWDNRLKLFEAPEMLIDGSLVHLPKLVNGRPDSMGPINFVVIPSFLDVLYFRFEEGQCSRGSACTSSWGRAEAAIMLLLETVDVIWEPS